MQAVFKVPNYAVPQAKSQLTEDWVKNGIQGNNVPILHIVPHLPADTPRGSERSVAFPNDSSLLVKVSIKLQPPFVFLPEVIRRGGDNELHRF
jgi:hypothetical protein